MSEEKGIAYTVVRSRRRTAAIEVDREARVIVRVPLRFPASEIERWVNERREWILYHIERRQQYLATHPEPSAEECERLRRLAKEVLPQRVAYFSARMGVVPTGVRITGAKTRFGSCSGKNALSFSYRLMQYPPEAVDYVVVHELAHIRHHDHSAAFYAFVERELPNYRARRALLR